MHDESDDDSEEECMPFDRRSHSLCSLDVIQYNIPTRLIDVGSHDDKTRLCAAAIFGKEIRLQYAALSHCWGSAPIEMVTTTANQDNMLQKLSVQFLGKTFQDAITATRTLGLRYLWIDCLCILQNSIEDWTEESMKMGSIYANCIVNLVAAAAKSSQEGCF